MKNIQAYLFSLSAAVLLLSLGCANESTESQSDQITIKLGYVSPQTGPLAAFGESDAFITSRILKAMNAQKIKVDGKTAVFEIKIIDSQSNPTRAGEVARNLIDQHGVHLLLAGNTPETTNPVAAISESKKVPCITTLAPISPWLMGGPYTYSHHFFWDLNDVINVFLDMWETVPTNKVVGGLWPNDADGAVWAKEFTRVLTEKGYTVIDPGRYPNGTADFTAFIQEWKANNVEILTGVPIPPDWASCWRQCSQQNFKPKVASVGKAILFPAAVEAIGEELPQGLSSELWWSPNHPFKSSLSNETPKSLADAYPKQWTQTLGYTYALFEVAFDVFKRAGSTDRDKLLAAIKDTDLNTMVGNVQFDSQNVGRTPLVGGQWVKGKKHPWDLEIVTNQTFPKIATTAEMVMIPGATEM